MSVRFGSIYHVACSVLVAASSVLFVGCALESEVEVDDSELVDEAASAFTEATCATTSTGVVTSTDTLFCGASAVYNSASATYGSSSCTNAHLVQMNGSYHMHTIAYPINGNDADADTEAECNSLTANLRRWRGGSTTDVAYHGSWHSGGGFCRMIPNSGTDPFVANGDRFVVQMKKGASFIRVGLAVESPTC